MYNNSIDHFDSNIQPEELKDDSELIQSVAADLNEPYEFTKPYPWEV